MKTYEGRREGTVAVVTVDGHPLSLRLDLRNHSPSGFEWGYCHKASAQLALAILADHLGDDSEALEFYQRFKWATIVYLPAHWTLTSRDIDALLHSLREYEIAASN